MRALSLMAMVGVLCLGACSSSEDACGALVFEPEVLDFEGVFVGGESTREVALRNVGSCPVRVESVSHRPGDPVRLELSTWRLEPGESASLAVTLDAGCVLTETYEAEVEVRGAGGARVVLPVTGRPISGQCQGPTELDFGAVPVGQVGEVSFSLENPTRAPLSFELAAPSSPVFSLAPGTPTGRVELAPEESLTVTVQFRPVEQGSAVGMMNASFCPCSLTHVRLTGTGVAHLLEWDPATVNLGYATPGAEVRQPITFRNWGVQRVVVGPFKMLNGSEFAVETPGGAGTLEIPGATKDEAGEWSPGSAAIAVVGRPSQLGPRQTHLQFMTSLPTMPTGSIPVKVFGGGPDIQVTPSPTLSFGQVAYFPDGSSFQKRLLTILNVGTAPAAPDPAANLRLGQDPSGTGQWSPPYYEVVPMNPGTGTGEFEVIVPSTYDPSRGLEARAGLNRADLEVKFTPASVGLKQALLRIYSNDPDEPVVEVTVTAEAQQFPGCDYDVSLPHLAFGLIAPGEHLDLTFTIRNIGVSAGDTCLLSGVGFAPGSHAGFTLPHGPLASVELAPGGTQDVVVRFHPQGPMPAGVFSVSGAVQFFMSSPTRPQAGIGLSAQVGPPCIKVRPSLLDLGTARAGCASETRHLEVANVCETPLAIAGATIPASEFTFDPFPSFPPAGFVVSRWDPPISIPVKYTPANAGSDRQQLSVGGMQDGVHVTRMALLKGAESAQGLHTDAFTLPSKRPLDVLFVISDGPNMGPHQTALAQAIPTLVQHAANANVDLHVAAITTDISPVPDGAFVSGPGHPDPVLTSASTNLVNELVAKVSVGTGGPSYGSCLETAVQALTPPLTWSTNAGFLRPEAPLAIFCISDHIEMVQRAATDYVNALRNAQPRSSLFAVNGFTQACAIDNGVLASVADAEADLCSVNWSQFLTDAIDARLDSAVSFPLSSDWDSGAGPLSVTLNGTAVPSTTSGGAQIWSYDASAEAIVFDPAHAPVAGDVIDVTYPVICF